MNKRGERPWCDHCNRPSHIREKCWQLHGKPANWQPWKQTDGRDYQTQYCQDEAGYTDPFAPFTKEQIKHLGRLLNQSSSGQSHVNRSSGSTIGSCSVAQPDNFYSVLHSSIQSKDPWIIDSGASDHMTGGSNLFYSYIPCSNHTTIKIVDGSLTSVDGIGTIRISQNLVLKSVLHVPTLKCNWISISKTTSDNHCFAKFSSLSCQFQELSSGRTIGCAKVHDGLY